MTEVKPRAAIEHENKEDLHKQRRYTKRREKTETAQERRDKIETAKERRDKTETVY